MKYDYLYMDPWSADKREGNLERKPLYICLSGNSGVGKSTLLKQLSSSLFQHDPYTIAIDEKSVHHSFLQYLFDDTNNYGYLIQLNFMIQRALLIKSWIAKGFNLVMERSHLEDYIFINFMLKTGYINESHHRAYMLLWEEINHIIPVPDLIVFLDYSAEHSLQHLHADEIHGIRPREFPDEVTKVKWIKGWHDEYQYFLNNLPENLRSRVMICQRPDNIDEFSDIVINKINMLRR
ncbi:deoxynucleoside kinase [Xenorhabdus sp. PB62.4]|uniref:deoxynucleoside kinase n=1 Tax=Xenorhabdus sp. PB62.4 TaxID=1851573 RepID=UPI001656DC0B|nr:deoxynucleoside kinase [Xenorhabdus sp. PB62.4]MBC8953049.1 deoxynucleoside kinase [Xenorhabdus sp. PB62.4]